MQATALPLRFSATAEVQTVRLMPPDSQVGVLCSARYVERELTLQLGDVKYAPNAVMVRLP